MPRRDSRPQRRRHAAPAAVVFTARGCLTPRWFRSVAAWAALTGLLAAAAPATALQVLTPATAWPSRPCCRSKEPTRIRIDGAAITDVFGNIHSSNCGPAAPSSSGSNGAPPAAAIAGREPGGESSWSATATRARSTSARSATRPSRSTVVHLVGARHLHAGAAQGRHPADTIVIRDPGQRALQAMQSRPAPRARRHRWAPPPTTSGAEDAALAMASDRVPPDIRVDELNQPIQLWAEARFSLMRRYEGRGLVGEKYLLQNVSQAVMVLAEQEFDRPDSPSGGQVLAVAVEHHNLRPGETTNVFVIRRGGQ